MPHSNKIYITTDILLHGSVEAAENTMNKLVGWYGFESNDRLNYFCKDFETPYPESSKIQRFSKGPERLHVKVSTKRKSRSRIRNLVKLNQSDHSSNTLKNPNCMAVNHKIRKAKYQVRRFSVKSTRGIENTGDTESMTSENDTNSSCEENSNSQLIITCSSEANENLDLKNCCWCHRAILNRAPDFLTTCDGPRYCSESCFTQSRRASFKRAKTCDWCKHVRHAVSYVDFQDGASQLQFCSDKCLNQYKMHIFCKETQAHLDMNPHLCNQAFGAVVSGDGGLITPELWLRNCRSRSVSPASSTSVSPGRSIKGTSVRSVSPKSSTTSLFNCKKSPVLRLYKPAIAVAPASKLMPKDSNLLPKRNLSKHIHKKRNLPISNLNLMDNETGSAFGKNFATLKSNNNDSVNTFQLKEVMNPTNETHSSPVPKTKTNHISFKGSALTSNASNINLPVPPLSPNSNDHTVMSPRALNATYTNLEQRSYTSTKIFASSSANTKPKHLTGPLTEVQYNPDLFPYPLPLHHLSNNLVNKPAQEGLPRSSTSASLSTKCTSYSPRQAEMNGLEGLSGFTPPITVMVPYPMVIPLPIPIPVPLPLIDFYKAYLSSSERERFDQGYTQIQEASLFQSSHPQSYRNSYESPLDFTSTKDKLLEETKRANISLLKIKNKCKNTIPDLQQISETRNNNSVQNADEGSQNNKMKSENEDKVGGNYMPPSQSLDVLFPTNHVFNQTEKYESTRPLRKRKSAFGCEFQEMKYKNSNGNASKGTDKFEINEIAVTIIDNSP